MNSSGKQIVKQVFIFSFFNNCLKATFLIKVPKLRINYISKISLYISVLLDSFALAKSGFAKYIP